MKKILTVIADLFDEREMIYPAYRVKEAGYEIDYGGDDIRVYNGKEGLSQKTNVKFSDVNVDDYEGLLIPGGYAPDKMRRNEDLLRIVREFNDQNKPIAMICHAGWVGISAKILDRKTLTSTQAIRDDMENAGVNWVDQELAIDGNIVTSRNPGDLHVYVKGFLDLLEK